LPPQRVPLLGLASAFLFAVQMLNFPIAAGTSAHLVGTALVTALLGPGAALIVIAAVLLVQCLLFADGGVLALGANLFNMGLVGAVVSYAVYAPIQRWLGGWRGALTGVAFAGWAATVLAATACAAELAWAGTVSWKIGFTAIVGVHALSGLAEGAISALVLLAVARARPELVAAGTGAGGARAGGAFVVCGLLAALGLAWFLAPLACPWPDALEAMISRLGLASSPSGVAAMAPFPEYTRPGGISSFWAVATVGVGGPLAAFGLAFAWSGLLLRRGSTGGGGAR
jgi:cobalt/nickel transport system permease protein